MSDVYEFSPAYLFVAELGGELVHVSRSLREHLAAHLAAPLAEGAKLDALGQPEDAEALAELVEAAARAGADTPVSCTIHVANARGEIDRMRCQVRRAGDGRLHGALDQDTSTARIERRLLRAAMETLDIVVFAVDTEGTFVYHDGRALTTAGLQPNQFLGLNLFDLYPPDQAMPVRTTLAGEAVHAVTEAHDVHWETWSVPLRDDAGEVEYCVSIALDITENVRTRRELERQLETIKTQQEAIRDLSTPLIEVWDQVLTVPLVGTIHDSDRINVLSERLLERVTRSGVRFVILDLTGVESIDTATASDILRIVRSLALLGSEGLLTGISPIVARTLVGLGIGLDAVPTRRTLRDGLRYCTAALRA